MAGMKGLKKRRRVQVIIAAFACIAGLFVVLWYVPDDAFQYYRSPSEVNSAPPTSNEIFRMGGLVVANSRTLAADDGSFKFDVTDCIATIAVKYVGSELPPVLFEEGSGTVLTGKFDGETFLATSILAKHDEEYRPKEVDETLKAEGACEHPESY